MKNSTATLFFRASAGYSKLLNNQKYMFNTVKNIRATLFFRPRASCSKILHIKSIFHTSNNFWATLFFRASASYLKFLNVQRIFNTVKNSRATLFFRESAGYSKLLNNKKYTFFSQKHVQAQDIKMIKYSAIEIWSKIPPEIKNKTCLALLLAEYKKYILLSY